MTWGEYYSDHLGSLLLHLVSAGALSLFLLALGTAPGVLCIILLVWLLGLSITHATAFLRQKNHLRQLEAIMAGLDQKHLFAACVPKPHSAYERHLYDLLRRAGRAMTSTVSNAQATPRDYQEYIESWVHEVKAPITAAQLICRSVAPEPRRKLLRELGQIENHVERALFYARAESPERDFVVREVSLSSIVSQALERHRALLIQSGMGIETEGLNCTVYTDEKWAAFLLGQLLQNAVRYRRDAQPVLVLSARLLGRQVQLTVADNGIGIPAHELPRIFDRGFTGSNGRARGGSTGMGLTICRKLAGFLQIDLAVQSAQGQGTCVTLTFPSRENLSKL